jgi:Bacterial Ig-like domain (group 3)
VSSYESASHDCNHGVPAHHHRAGLSVGYKARLTRTVTGAPISGEAITFTAGTTMVCSATTNNAEGIARCGERSLLPAVLNHGYTATYAGTSLYAPSTAHGTLN